jgi:hypothetical protein
VAGCPPSDCENLIQDLSVVKRIRHLAVIVEIVLFLAIFNRLSAIEKFGGSTMTRSNKYSSQTVAQNRRMEFVQSLMICPAVIRTVSF